MSKDTDTGSVRQARMTAKKLVRKGETTHQQALDMVARESGHRNWSAFLRSEMPEGTMAKNGSAAPSKRKARDLDVLETGILEQAASNRKHLPWAPGPLVHAGSAALNIIVFSFVVMNEGTFAIALAAAAIVAIAQIAAHRSNDGLVVLRRWVITRVMPVAVALWIVGVVLLSLTAMRHGLMTLGSPWAATPAIGRWGVAIYSAGLGAYYTSTRAHRAMTLAKPQTVRPVREEDRVIPASAPIASPVVARTSRVLTYGALAVSIAGLAGLLWVMVGMFITHDVDVHLMSMSISVLMTGGLVAAFLSLGMDLDKATPEYRIEDPSRRAARARRFLTAGGKARRA